MAGARFKGFLVVAALAAAAAVGWFFVSPLFIDEVADETLPISIPRDSVGMPTAAEIEAMSPQQRTRAMAAAMAAAADGPDRVMDEAMPDSAPEILLMGEFRDADAIHRGSGRALVYRLADGSRLLRLEDFRVTNGPALVVLLVRDAYPRSAAAVEAAGYVELGALKGNVGNQNYPIPAELDLERFGSVVIWCQLFDVLFSPAPLG